MNSLTELDLHRRDNHFFGVVNSRPRSALPPTGTYMGDPPPGLSVRGAFFGRKSDKEVCGGVVPVVSEPSAR